METMPGWGWVVVVLTVVVAALLVVTNRMVSAAAHRQVQGRLDAALVDAGRLPDAVDRALRAEARIEAVSNEASASAAREAGLLARTDEIINKVHRLETDVADRDLSLSGLRESNEGLQLRLATATATVDTRNEEVARIRQERDAYEQQRDVALRSADQLRGVAAIAEANLASKIQETEQLINERDLAREDVRVLSTRFQEIQSAHATAVSERDAAKEAVTETRAFLAKAEREMRTAFTEAASKVFDEKSILLDQRIQTSSEASKAGLEATLKPFAEKVITFQTRVEQLGADQAKEHAQLVGTIGELKGLNQNMASATEALTKALKGNSKTRGDWGELILDTVLKASGLEEGRNYVTQAHAVDEDTGSRRRPDVVVLLPDDRKIVVDSKVNLIAWNDAQNAETFEEQQAALVRHVAALRAHVRDLADKNYPKALGNEALDLTVLFVPIEGALSAALSMSDDLQGEALGKRVVFASPNTLMALLRVVERLWTRDKIQKQVTVIGEEASKLLDSLNSFLGEFDIIEERLQKVGSAVSDARRRLRDSPQSVVSRAGRLVEAGARGKKALREELMPVAGPAGVPIALDAALSGDARSVPP
jgi:DNA recombination protein RmuC